MGNKISLNVDVGTTMLSAEPVTEKITVTRLTKIPREFGKNGLFLVNDRYRIFGRIFGQFRPIMFGRIFGKG